MPSNHLILCGPLLPLPSIFPSIRVFSNEAALHIRWPKYWSFSFNISLSNEHLGLVSFRMDCLGLLAVQGTLKSLLQHHSSKTPILWRSAFFMVQLSHPYMTTRKTIALIIWTFVGNVMSLLFNTLPRFVIAFLARSKHLLISWLKSLSAVILKPKKIVCHRFHFFPISLPWSDGLGTMILVFWMLSFKPTFSFSSLTFIKRLFSSSAWGCSQTWLYIGVTWGAFNKLLMLGPTPRDTYIFSLGHDLYIEIFKKVSRWSSYATKAENHCSLDWETGEWVLSWYVRFTL